MAARVAAVHGLLLGEEKRKDVDRQDKPGHDD
jgi:hypothetical protein